MPGGHADAIPGETSGVAAEAGLVVVDFVRLQRSLLAVAARLGMAEAHPGRLPRRGGHGADGAPGVSHRRPRGLGVLVPVGDVARNAGAVHRAEAAEGVVVAMRRRWRMGFREGDLEALAGEKIQPPTAPAPAPPCPALPLHLRCFRVFGGPNEDAGKRILILFMNRNTWYTKRWVFMYFCTMVYHPRREGFETRIIVFGGPGHVLHGRKCHIQPLYCFAPLGGDAGDARFSLDMVSRVRSGLHRQSALRRCSSRNLPVLLLCAPRRGLVGRQGCLP